MLVMRFPYLFIFTIASCHSFWFTHPLCSARTPNGIVSFSLFIPFAHQECVLACGRFEDDSGAIRVSSMTFAVYVFTICNHPIPISLHLRWIRNNLIESGAVGICGSFIDGTFPFSSRDRGGNLMFVVSLRHVPKDKELKNLAF